MLGDSLFLSSSPRAFPGIAIQSEFAMIQAPLMRVMLYHVQFISSVLSLIQLSAGNQTQCWALAQSGFQLSLSPRTVLC